MSAKKILIVDDDEHLLLGLAAKLKAKGYAVVSAMDGVAAVAVARQESPDLILLDLGLPAGDGFLVLERLRGYDGAYGNSRHRSQRPGSYWQQTACAAGWGRGLLSEASG
jgi:CheY-like chemotaxis protein